MITMSIQWVVAQFQTITATTIKMVAAKFYNFKDEDFLMKDNPVNFLVNTFNNRSRKCIKFDKY
jgi:hypothetical protein